MRKFWDGDEHAREKNGVNKRSPVGKRAIKIHFDQRLDRKYGDESTSYWYELVGKWEGKHEKTDGGKRTTIKIIL